MLAPPGVETLDSADDYFVLLARRVEWQLEDWLVQYSDELPVPVDRDDPAAIRAGTLEMIQRYVPEEIGFGIQGSLSNRAIAQALVTPALYPNILLPKFPVVLPPASGQDSSFAACITEESTLKGWLIESRP